MLAALVFILLCIQPGHGQVTQQLPSLDVSRDFIHLDQGHCHSHCHSLQMLCFFIPMHDMALMTQYNCDLLVENACLEECNKF